VNIIDLIWIRFSAGTK